MREKGGMLVTFLNLLILTGDKLKEVNRFGKDRYFESVPAIQLVKKINPALNIAVAFNPFKYREEDCMAQYFKLEKKLAQVLIIS